MSPTPSEHPTCPLPAGSTGLASAPPHPITDRTLMIAGLSGDEVRRRIGRAARGEETERRLLAFYLVEMEARRLYQETGHGSTLFYAEAKHGLDRRRVAELLRVGAKLLELRELDRAFCDGRLCWSKVLIVARMATPEHEAAWVQRAIALDVRGLQLLAARSRVGGAPRAPGDEKGLPEIRFPITLSLRPLQHAKLQQAQRRLGDELGREADVVGLLETLLDMFASMEPDGSVPGHKRVDASAYRVQLYEGGTRGDPLLVETEDGPLPVDAGGPGGAGAISEALRCDAGVRNHHVPGAHGPGAHDHDHRARDVKTPTRLRKRVLRRDGHRCRSCRARLSLTAHHIEFLSHGGRTLIENLITLCLRCHGLVHADLLVIVGNSAQGARFVDSAGRPIRGTQQLAELKRLLAPETPRVLEGPVLPPAGGVEAAPAVPAPGAGSSEAAPRAREISAAVAPAAGVVTLASLPAEVDASWWRRHAHLVRDRGENGSLRFEAGTPVVPPPSEAQPPAPAAEAFAGLVGQDERIARLRRVAEGSRARGKRFPHVLLTGPAGTGKTTIARGIAAVAGQSLTEVSAPLLTDRSTWVRLLAGLDEGSLLFLDEAHALPRALHEVLLEALSERRLSLVLSDGARARRLTLRLPAFTLVAATTDEGSIPTALRSRFGLREILVHYGEEVLAEVVRGAAEKEGAETTVDGARRLARASRGTPREALKLLERALEEIATGGERRLDVEQVEGLLGRLGYDEEGLDAQERRYMQVLRESPVPVPLSRLARTLGTTPHTLVEHVEPWLFLRGLVQMTPGGRTAASYVRLLGSSRDAPHVRRARTRAFRTS